MPNWINAAPIPTESITALLLAPLSPRHFSLHAVSCIPLFSKSPAEIPKVYRRQVAASDYVWEAKSGNHERALRQPATAASAATPSGSNGALLSVQGRGAGTRAGPARAAAPPCLMIGSQFRTRIRVVCESQAAAPWLPSFLEDRDSGALTGHGGDGCRCEMSHDRLQVHYRLQVHDPAAEARPVHGQSVISPSTCSAPCRACATGLDRLPDRGNRQTADLLPQIE